MPTSSNVTTNHSSVMSITGLIVGGVLLTAAVIGLAFLIRRYRHARCEDAEAKRMSRIVTAYTLRRPIDGIYIREPFQPPQIRVPPPVSIRPNFPPPPYEYSSGRHSFPTLKRNSRSSSQPGLRPLYLLDMPC